MTKHSEYWRRFIDIAGKRIDEEYPEAENSGVRDWLNGPLWEESSPRPEGAENFNEREILLSARVNDLWNKEDGTPEISKEFKKAVLEYCKHLIEIFKVYAEELNKATKAPEPSTSHHLKNPAQGKLI